MSSKAQNPKVAGMDRRTFIKGCTIATGAIALGGIPSAGAVSYPWQEQVEEGFEAMAPDTYSDGLAYAFGPGIGVPINVIQHVTQDSSLSTEAPILWTTANGEGEAYVSFTQMVNNYLEDTNTIAAIEGRSAIADAYVDNKTTSEGKTALDNAVLNYYSTLQGNAWRTISSYIAQCAYIQTIARNKGDIVDFFVSIDLPTVTDSSGATADPDGNRYMDSTNFVQNEITAVNSENFKVQFPTFHIPASDGSKYEGGITQEILETYDPERSDGAFVVTTDSGVEMALDFDFIVANVPEGDNMPSKGLFSLSDFMEIHNEISGQGANVTTSFDESFVSDLFTAMDNGEISPTDVRGASALAREMGGTDDVYADSYRMAMLQQLGMEQPDLTDLASMEIGYTGFTEVNGNVDENGNRQIKPFNYSNATYNGLMFAGETPSNGFTIDETYASDTLAMTCEGGTIKIHNLQTKQKLYEFNFNASYVAFSENSQYIICGDGSVIQCREIATGNVVWEKSNSSSRIEITKNNNIWCSSGNILEVKTGDSIGSFAGGSSQGSKQWDVSHSGEVYAYNNSGTVEINKNGETITTNYDFSRNGDLRVSDSYLLKANSGGDLEKYDIDNKEVVETFGISYIENPIAFHAKQNIAIALDENNDSFSYHIINTTDMSEIAKISDVSGSSFRGVSIDALGQYVYLANGVYDLVNSTYTSINVSGIETSSFSFSTKDIDGYMSKTLFYDANAGKERRLNNGIITIKDMSDRDGNTIDNTNTDPPDYGDYNNTKYIQEVMNSTNTTIHIFNNESSGGGIPNYSGPNFDPGDWVPDSIVGNTFGIPNWAIALLGGTGFLVAVKAFFSRN